MAQLKRKYIDKHWFMFIIRGILAAGFGCFALFGGMADLESMIAIISVFLLFMGIVDAAGALYASTKKHGWINSIIDSAIDVIAAVTLLFCANGDLTISLIIISVYTIISGVVDLFHGFLSTVDPTDRFIRVLAGVAGCVMGAVIINAGDFEITTFIRFFGAYLLIVGITSMIYGVHNRAQKHEDYIARSETNKRAAKTRAANKKRKK
ncbi:DUF308 domain-containing protein [Candidatus Saccharibacteria bacterium]|nr:DUF308 domain-containing protein [Candidatus Saccharibacteria bacterium]